MKDKKINKKNIKKNDKFSNYFWPFLILCLICIVIYIICTQYGEFFSERLIVNKNVPIDINTENRLFKNIDSKAFGTNNAMKSDNMKIIQMLFDN